MLNDELTGLADNIRSRTGYKEKMTVPEMKDHVNELSWVNHNLLSGTSDQYQTIYSDNSVWLGKTTATSDITGTYGSHPGDWYTYSATISNYSSHPICHSWGSFGNNNNNKNVYFAGVSSNKGLVYIANPVLVKLPWGVPTASLGTLLLSLFKEVTT